MAEEQPKRQPGFQPGHPRYGGSRKVIQIIDETVPGEKKRMATPGSFKLGHGKLGGRKRGSVGIRNADARKICDALGIDPLEWILCAVKSGFVRNSDGTATKLSTEARVRAAAAAIPFVYARRAHTTGFVQHDLQLQQPNDLEPIMRDPKLAKMADELAFAMLNEPDNSPVYDADYSPVE